MYYILYVYLILCIFVDVFRRFRSPDENRPATMIVDPRTRPCSEAHAELLVQHAIII